MKRCPECGSICEIIREWKTITGKNKMIICECLNCGIEFDAMENGKNDEN
jgi:hypothetical protein